MRARIQQGLQVIRARWAIWRTAGLLAGMVGFGLLAALGAHRYIQERIDVERVRLGAAHERVEVLVASRAMQRGEAVSIENLAVRALPRDLIPGGALSPARIDAVQGLRLQWPMQPGEPLLASAVFAAESAGLSSRLKPGIRALTIAVDETNAISGLLQPGDRIDLLLSWRPAPAAGMTLPELTRTIMQDVVVMATGRNARATPTDEGSARTFSAITVEVDPEQAQRLVVAQRSGRLTAVLRNPSDREAHEDRLLDVHELMGISRPSGPGLAGMVQTVSPTAWHGKAASREGSSQAAAVSSAAAATVAGPGAAGRTSSGSRGVGDPGIEVIVGGRGPLPSGASGGSASGAPATVSPASGRPATGAPAGIVRPPQLGPSPDPFGGAASGQPPDGAQRPALAPSWPDLSPPTTVPLLR